MSEKSPPKKTGSVFCMQHVLLRAQVVAKCATDATLWQFLRDFLRQFDLYCLRPWPGLIPQPCESSAAASPHGGRIKGIASSESGLLYSAREINGVRWGGEKNGCVVGVPFRNSSLMAPFFRFPSALARLPSASEPAPGETHSSFIFLTTKLPPPRFWLLALITPYSAPYFCFVFLLVFFLSAHFRAKISIYISEVSVSSVFRCRLMEHTACQLFH